ncbi:MAG: hypothetical protein JWM11_5055 [Planctomycetaceae bacterium]|nr:hypothetical protein [Planctomycetaceae bacterium]
MLQIISENSCPPRNDSFDVDEFNRAIQEWHALHDTPQLGLRLSRRDEARLAELEQTISTNCNSFITIATAIYRIAAEDLFRPYHSITRYCAVKWNFSRNDTSRYKRAGKVLDELAGSRIMPTSESQCRQLAKLRPGSRKAVWDSLVSISPDGKVTAEDIADACCEYFAEVKKNDREALLRRLKRIAKNLQCLETMPLTPDIIDHLKEVAVLLTTVLYGINGPFRRACMIPIGPPSVPLIEKEGISLEELLERNHALQNAKSGALAGSRTEESITVGGEYREGETTPEPGQTSSRRPPETLTGPPAEADLLSPEARQETEPGPPEYDIT